jgi:hypothetical protein
MERPRSTFVTAVAWIAIIFSAVSTAIGALQNALVWLLVPQELLEAEMSRQMPAVPLFVFHYFQWIVLALWVGSLVTLVVGIGLLRRQEWARIAFIVLLAVSALATIALSVLQATSMETMFPDAGSLPADVQRAKTVFTAFMCLLNVVVVLAHGWLIWKFVSLPIREEFTSVTW